MSTFAYSFYFKQFVCSQLSVVDDIKMIIKKHLYPLILNREFTLPTIKDVQKHLHYNWFENDQGIVFQVCKAKLTKKCDIIMKPKTSDIFEYTINNYVIWLRINFDKSLCKEVHILKYGKLYNAKMIY